MQWSTGNSSKTSRLLIEPYWNWNNRSNILIHPANFLLIEPYWNWNLLWSTMGLNLSYTFNRTILELKSMADVEKLQIETLLIEPYWNWNQEKWTHEVNDKYLLIEPYWNWNIIICIEVSSFWLLLIEPYWNWNAPCSHHKQWFYKLLIEPYWNWNNIRALFSV